MPTISIQHLMDYWAEHAGRFYSSRRSWKPGGSLARFLQVKKKRRSSCAKRTISRGKRRFKSDLIPAGSARDRYFAAEPMPLLPRSELVAIGSN